MAWRRWRSWSGSCCVGFPNADCCFASVSTVGVRTAARGAHLGDFEVMLLLERLGGGAARGAFEPGGRVALANADCYSALARSAGGQPRAALTWATSSGCCCSNNWAAVSAGT